MVTSGADFRCLKLFYSGSILIFNQQSVDLHKKFVEAGVKTEFITVKGGLHGKFDREKNTEINKAIAEFLKQLGLSKNED